MNENQVGQNCYILVASLWNLVRNFKQQQYKKEIFYELLNLYFELQQYYSLQIKQFLQSQITNLFQQLNKIYQADIIILFDKIIYQKKFNKLLVYMEEIFKDAINHVTDKNHLKIACERAQQIVDSLTQKINKSQLEVSNKPLNLTNLKQKDIINSPLASKNKKLSQIIGKKQLIQRQLQKIQQQQSRLKYAHKQHSSLSKQSNSVRFFRSQLKKQDSEKLKQLLLISQQYQKQLKQKTKAFEQNVAAHKKQQEQLMEKQKIEKCQERREQIQKKLDENQKKQIERAAKMEQDRKKLLEIKKKKWIYEDMQEKWRNIQQQEAQKRKQLYEQNKKSLKQDFSQIKQHEKKYEEIIKKQKQQRQKKLSNMNEKTSQVRIIQSKFFDIIQEEDAKRKEQQEIKKNLAKVQSQMKLAYAEKVRNNMKPKVKKPETKAQQDKKLSQIRCLSMFQMHQKGNAYMKQVHSGIQKISVPAKDLQQQKKTTTPFKYKDYLKQTRMGKTALNSINKNSKLLQIRKVLKSSNDNMQDKYNKAKMLVGQMQQKNKQGNTKNLVQTINVKIQILKQMMQ